MFLFLKISFSKNSGKLQDVISKCHQSLSVWYFKTQILLQLSHSLLLLLLFLFLILLLQNWFFQIILLSIVNTFLTTVSIAERNLSNSKECWKYKVSYFCVDVSILFYFILFFPFEFNTDMKQRFWSSHVVSGCYLLQLTALWKSLLPLPLTREWTMYGYGCTIYIGIDHHKVQMLEEVCYTWSTYSLEQIRNIFGLTKAASNSHKLKT